MQNRNEKMAEEDSSARRKYVFYDHRQGVTITCSDSDEELEEDEVVGQDFSEGEDKLLR